MSTGPEIDLEDPAEIAKLLSLMKENDCLRRERCPRTKKLMWHFKRYEGSHWVDVTHEILSRALAWV